MGKTDIKSKAYLGQPDVFADVFNYYIYGGQQVICPKHLQECDITEISMPYGTDLSGNEIQKYRDLLKLAVTRKDDEKAYILLGIEAQQHIHYAIPVRNMLYDAIQYTKQVEQAAVLHRSARDWKKRNSGEFLSGFYKDDKLFPVITLVLLLSAEPWDGPVSLHEMIKAQDQQILNLIPDYRIHLIIPRDLDDEKLSRFHTSIREVMEFIKYSKDQKRLLEITKRNRNFQAMDRKAVELLNSCLNAGIKIKQNQEEINVCQAIEEMKMEERLEGRLEGLSEGRLEGAHENLLQNLGSLMKTLHLTPEQAMDALQVPETMRLKYRPLLKDPSSL